MKPIIATLALCFSAPSLAAIEIGEYFSFSGFGSTSWAKSDNQTPLFVHRNIQDESCFDCDTTIGFQLDGYFNNFQASAQVVKRPQDDWDDPELEWAFIGYEWQDFTFRIGQQRLPLFLTSEYYYVGHAYTTARPPTEVYDSLLGITSYKGVSVAWNMDLDDYGNMVFTPFYGIKDSRSVTISDSTQVDLETDHMWGVNLTYYADNYRVNFSYLRSYYDQKVTISNIMIGPIVLPPQVAETYDLNVELFSFGFEYEWDAATLTFEAERNDRTTAWYTAVDYSYNKLTPYLVYGQLYDQDEEKASDSVTLGVRYDIIPTVSVNAEWQSLHGEDGRRGPFVETPQDLDANLFTIMVNFVF
ncbi:porin [Vibrio intestinalis]|uniref:porin n=1 Tax=Vibrio intestinalis TaxID=2933291 RepID=UPI0021A839EE|nr:porin [Vibrio intestinalis]